MWHWESTKNEIGHGHGRACPPVREMSTVVNDQTNCLLLLCALPVPDRMHGTQGSMLGTGVKMRATYWSAWVQVHALPLVIASCSCAPWEAAMKALLYQPCGRPGLSSGLVLSA